MAEHMLARASGRIGPLLETFPAMPHTALTLTGWNRTSRLDLSLQAVCKHHLRREPEVLPRS
jgi:hypothetical protein